MPSFLEFYFSKKNLKKNFEKKIPKTPNFLASNHSTSDIPLVLPISS